MLNGSPDFLVLDQRFSGLPFKVVPEALPEFSSRVRSCSWIFSEKHFELWPHSDRKRFLNWWVEPEPCGPRTDSLFETRSGSVGSTKNTKDLQSDQKQGFRSNKVILKELKTGWWWCSPQVLVQVFDGFWTFRCGSSAVTSFKPHLTSFIYWID